jgi:hypothetical protein
VVSVLPLDKKDFESSPDLNKLKAVWIGKLQEIASKLGVIQEREVHTNGGRIDLVWYYAFEYELPSIGLKLPLLGFEVESSWRNRKHIKGDIFNLLELSPALGVILFLSEGFSDVSKLKGNVEAAKRYAKNYSGVSRIGVWTDKEVDELYERLFRS